MMIKSWRLGFVIVIGDWDCGLGFGKWDWGLGLGIGIRDWDWALGLGNSDWGLGLGIGVWIGIGDWY